MAKEYIKSKGLEPDEIFMDSENIPGFDQERFEGRLERPLGTRTFVATSFIILLVFVIFLYKAFDLEIVNGDALRNRADDNRLLAISLRPERGMIYDRNGKVLAQNKPAFELRLDTDNKGMSTEKSVKELQKLQQELGRENLVLSSNMPNTNPVNKMSSRNLAIFDDWLSADAIKRRYADLPLTIEPVSYRDYHGDESIANIVGYIGYPDAEEIIAQNISDSPGTLIGKIGIEQEYDDELAGSSGVKLTEVNSKGEVFSEAVQSLARNGSSVYLTIDSDLQRAVYNAIKTVVIERGFRGGAAVIMNPGTGEVLSLASYPSFNPDMLSSGKPAKDVQNILTSDSHPLFNRPISGLYAPGSIFKTIIAAGALEEKIITPEKQVLSTGSISLPNPFDPAHPSVFYDWKAHGWVDMRRAIMVSSDVYFYTVGGGFGDVKGLGVLKIKDWALRFGLGHKTGVDLPGEKDGLIPDPAWKEKNNKTNPIWRIGDTYHLSIGQGAIQVTPIQIAKVASIIANGGKIFEPKILKEIRNTNTVKALFSPKMSGNVAIDQKNLNVVREGMRLAASPEGTAQAVSGLEIEIGGKTGTAELGVSKDRVNSWFMGFFPFSGPKVAMAVVLESGSASNLVGAPAASRVIIEWMKSNRPELLLTN